MKPRTGRMFLILFGVPLLLALPITFIGAKFLGAGTLEVHVSETGPNGGTVDVVLPAGLVPAAASLSSVCSIGGCHIDSEAREAIRLAADAIDLLRDVPDAVLVDVRTDTEVVLVEKRGGELQVDVSTPEETVRATIPLRAVRSALRLI